MKINSINGYYINDTRNNNVKNIKNTQFAGKSHSARDLCGLFGITSFSGGALLSTMADISAPAIITVASLAGIFAGIKGYSAGKELDKKIDVFEKESAERAKQYNKISE